MYQLIIAEKPSVAQSIAAVLGAKRRENGYLDGIKRDIGIEPSPPAFTTPRGFTYHVGDSVSSMESDSIETVGVLARVDEHHIWYTRPDAPKQEPVSIDRNSFERYLDTRYFEASEPGPQRVIAAQHTEQEKDVLEQNPNYQLLDRLRADCEYFLGAGNRAEKHLWAGSVYAQIVKMRELYDALPQKPEWLTEEAIDDYADRMAPQYQVVAYHHFENGFDEKQDYQTLEEAEKAAQGYPMNGSYNNTGSNIQVSHSDTALTFSGLTMIPDSDTTADYAFGYADVTPNGSPAKYGTAVNPYLPYVYTDASGNQKTKTGGDGFDLEWAVDISTRLPVDVTGKTFRYVRVYTAVLDNGTFGETSAEVCGIFTTANKSTATVGQTTGVSLTIDGENLTEYSHTYTEYGNIKYYDLTSEGLSSGSTIEASLSGANIYMNGSNTSTYTITSSTQFVRVIVQSGNCAPYIALLKIA